MNFPTLWCKWILDCVTMATPSVLVNGCSIEEFKLARGLRQGNPLSPFLFSDSGRRFKCHDQYYSGYKIFLPNLVLG